MMPCEHGRTFQGISEVLSPYSVSIVSLTPSGAPCLPWRDLLGYLWRSVGVSMQKTARMVPLGKGFSPVLEHRSTGRYGLVPVSVPAVENCPDSSSFPGSFLTKPWRSSVFLGVWDFLGLFVYQGITWSCECCFCFFQGFCGFGRGKSWCFGWFCLVFITCSFCHLVFVKEFTRFGRKISAKISESRLKPAENRPKFDSNSTRNRLNLS